MSKFIVCVFPNEKKAYEGVHAFKELHAEGSISLYDILVVERTADGKLSMKERTYDDAFLRTGLGAVFGALVGLIGGPPGVAIGLTAGSFLGSSHALLRGGVTDEFVEDILEGMATGAFAVLAEVQEDWTSPVDTRMEALGGKVLRETRRDATEDLIEKRAETHRAEVEERKAARAARKAEKMERKLDDEIVEVQGRLQRTADKARERLETTRLELEERVQQLQQQAARAKPDVQQRIDQRITAMRSDFGERERKLSHAIDLAKEALR
jgi:uncharacterized membrane protein